MIAFQICLAAALGSALGAALERFLFLRWPFSWWRSALFAISIGASVVILVDVFTPEPFYLA